MFDGALFAWGVAAAANLIAAGVNDARQSDVWPHWLELIYLLSFLLAIPALVVAVWAKATLKRMGAVVEDERTVITNRHASAVALGGALAAQAPYFFDVTTVSSAQAKFTVAAALVSYGAARLWLNREA
ncbi:hypothetical protein [Planobispora longispora]|uniref:Uncharacterized protein n=1 Tax=Planobispora longispora TaxID=28887 RepID=A0A8J3RKH9_9ACTN|nr:hypothetical protein [Planobispora longispora]BFE77538.1 hypothetical protein GCM10020093_001390 [Planobispora longispora]GIH73948.1 hypothetical protein Plo01_03770 [Planobispora longispora]